MGTAMPILVRIVAAILRPAIRIVMTKDEIIRIVTANEETPRLRY